jgi:branched-chain amino acid transport system permease protein
MGVLRSAPRVEIIGIFLALIAIVAGVLLPTILSSRYVIDLLSLCLIFALFAMSLDLLVGYMGHISFGHAAFFAMSAYTLAILTVRYKWDWLPASIVAIVAATLLAAVFGSFLSHLSGIQYGMVTFALSMVVWGLAIRWNSMTKGVNGIPGVGRPLIERLDFSGSSEYYYFVLGVFVVCAFLLFALVRSPFGLSMRGIKETQSRMRVLGYNVWLHKYITYVIAGFFAGVAGVLMGWFVEFVSPDDAALLLSAKGLLMVLAGGPGTLVGPIIGAAAVVLLENYVSAITPRWIIVMGILYIAVVVFLPGGLVQLLRQAIERFRQPSLNQRGTAIHPASQVQSHKF